MEPDVGEETAGLLAKERARQRGTSRGDARAGGEGEKGREGAPLQLGYAVCFLAPAPRLYIQPKLYITICSCRCFIIV